MNKVQKDCVLVNNEYYVEKIKSFVGKSANILMLQICNMSLSKNNVNFRVRL